MSTSINPSTRNKCIEVPANQVEFTTVKDFARHIGMAVAVFARLAMFQYIETHDAKEAQQEESRKRRDAPFASRASAGIAHKVARRRASARMGAGAGMRPIRV